jgi:branched-chain amino acid aminotransferase
MSDRATEQIDWDSLGFAFRETDTFYRCLGERNDGQTLWEAGEHLPFGPVTLSPAASFFSYGSGIFEGLKARRSPDGRVLLFRHADNALRFQRSAERLMMAPFPADSFVEAVEGVVRRNMHWVPPYGKGTFYIRPLQHAIEPKVGIRPGNSFWVLVFGCPVASYFGSDSDGVRLKLLKQGRVAPGGTGAAKAMGNYAGGIALAYPWQQQGFDDVLYLDARHVEYVTETSGSNVFVKLKSGKLLTPELDDQILAGLTRDSVIRIASERLGVEVEQRAIPLGEMLSDAEEVFCTGTAWTVQPVREIVVGEQAHQFTERKLQRAILEELIGIQSGQREDPYGWVTHITEM